MVVVISIYRRSSSLWTSLFAAYGGPYLFAAGLKVIQDLLAFLQPQLLRLLLAYISAYQTSRNDRDDVLRGREILSSPGVKGFAISFIMFAASVMQSIILNQVGR
jgi:ATP-binding cassette subfamily C (CFTR/MRP) protein 1